MPDRSSRFARRSFAGKGRRKTSWGIGPGDGSQVQLTAGTPTLIGSAISAVEDGITITRIRGELLMFLSSADALASGYFGAFGIGKGSLSAFNVGVGSMETPIADEGWDGWLYHKFFHLTASAPVAGGASAEHDMTLPVTAALRIDVDVKAQRKLVPEDVIYAVVDVAEIGVAVLQVYFRSRALALLP